MRSSVPRPRTACMSRELGQPDPDWLQWYAEHMARTLTEDGYRLIRLDAHQHRGVHSGEGVS